MAVMPVYLAFMSYYWELCSGHIGVQLPKLIGQELVEFVRLKISCTKLQIHSE